MTLYRSLCKGLLAGCLQAATADVCHPPPHCTQHAYLPTQPRTCWVRNILWEKGQYYHASYDVMARLHCHRLAVTWHWFYQTRSAWSWVMNSSSTIHQLHIYNFAPTLRKVGMGWEGLPLPHLKICYCRGKIRDSKAFPSRALIHSSNWSSLIKTAITYWLIPL